VDGVWVGDAPETMTVNIGSGLCCDCSFGPERFPIGAEWTVVAYGDDKIPQMGSACTYGANIDSESVTEVLGTARAPESRRTLFGFEF